MLDIINVRKGGKVTIFLKNGMRVTATVHNVDRGIASFKDGFVDQPGMPRHPITEVAQFRGEEICGVEY